ncbi:MAG: RNA 2',3'-cyclic phosphodiesterase [Deltaproteobacteria bacterium]|nr:RNA 2',3'-cyclic phosphodiesterase [Deltaproteobacteria bacterium]
MEEIRSFIAIEIPQPLKVKMEDLLKKLRRTEADVKWVRPASIHLTLKFLGSVPEEMLKKIALAISPVVASGEPFALHVQGLGCFPSSRNPRVIWLGINQGAEQVSSLQRAIEKQTAELSFPPETRPFTPHLTIGRVRSPKSKNFLMQEIEANKDVEIGAFQAKEVFLIKSELNPSGAIYTKLHAFPMRESQPKQMGF